MLKCRGIRHQLAHHFEGVAVGGIVLDGDDRLRRVQHPWLLHCVVNVDQIALSDGVWVDPLDAAMQSNVSIEPRCLNRGRTR